ncbi:MAG: hypothetical protein CMH70_00725 [Nitrosomonadaceae bacterium]|nr:hypothetical protein [Nitrosomonadaceae bacterium]|tara:strand:- start:738 stop:1130 length:393 start_codon:yes stop_codon:yes gene_type:complete
MSSTNKVFLSFALRDADLRDTLIEQINNENTPYLLEYLATKASWDPSWKEECQSKISECDGVIALITNQIIRADGQRWEIECAYKEKLPVLLLQGRSEKLAKKLPSIIDDKEFLDWTLPNIMTFINKLQK